MKDNDFSYFVAINIPLWNKKNLKCTFIQKSKNFEKNYNNKKLLKMLYSNDFMQKILVPT